MFLCSHWEKTNTNSKSVCSWWCEMRAALFAWTFIRHLQMGGYVAVRNLDRIHGSLIDPQDRWCVHALVNMRLPLLLWLPVIPVQVPWCRVRSAAWWWRSYSKRSRYTYERALPCVCSRIVTRSANHRDVGRRTSRTLLWRRYRFMTQKHNENSGRGCWRSNMFLTYLL